MNSRCFIISYRKCLGEVGGGTGVAYRLYLANKKYNLINNCIYIFSDVHFSQFDEIDDDFIKHNNTDSHKKTEIGLIHKIKKNKILEIPRHLRNRHTIRKYFQKLNLEYNFTNEDVYIFQDIEGAGVFLSQFNFERTVIVYHQQGSRYKEWSAFNMKNSIGYRIYLNSYQLEAMNKCTEIAFPSMGALESLLKSEPSFNGRLKNQEYYYLYNGFRRKNLSECIYSEETRNLIRQISTGDFFTFITVAALNYAKGVERIPEFLSQIDEEFLWIVIGDGIRYHSLLDEIKRCKIEHKVRIIREKLDHDDILKLFEYTDFYILFHRYSVFDYATIEAMAYGNIPILSNVGGNKEVIIDNNGVLVDDTTDSTVFKDFIKENDINVIKNRNMKIQQDIFEELPFLQRYAEVINKLKQKKRIS